MVIEKFTRKIAWNGRNPDLAILTLFAFARKIHQWNDDIRLHNTVSQNIQERRVVNNWEVEKGTHFLLGSSELPKHNHCFFLFVYFRTFKFSYNLFLFREKGIEARIDGINFTLSFQLAKGSRINGVIVALLTIIDSLEELE